MRKTRIFLALTALLIAILCCFVGCSSCKGESELTVTFNENRTAEIGKEYNPQISVSEGAELKSVKLTNAAGKNIILSQTYSFIPDEFGYYYYEVIAQSSKERQTFNFTLQVVDTEAPVVVNKPSTSKQIELGMYTEFNTDLEQIIVTDNYLEMLDFVTKKVVSISGNGKVEEKAVGYEKYFFDRVGEYNVKVELKDLAGNVSYVEYTLEVVDTVAPVINAYELNYAWLVDGKVEIPKVKATDLSSITESVTAKLNGSPLEIENGKVFASVGDVIEVVYTAKDESLNESIKTTKLKVLEYGKLMDKKDSELNTLFVADSGLMEYDDGLLYLNDAKKDVFGWREGSFNFGSVKAFSGISLRLVNYQYSAVDVTVIAVSGEVEKPIGMLKLAGKTDTLEEKVFILDLTKSELDKVDGWRFSVVSSDSVCISLKGMEYTTFADPYVEVSISDSYNLGDAFVYSVNKNGYEISEVSVTLTNMGTESVSLNANDEYEFSVAGDYVVDFTVDVGSKAFVVSKNFVVTDTGSAVILEKSFIGGRVGNEYELPNLTGASISLKDSQGKDVSVTNNKFTPQISGTYTATYLVGTKQIVRTFYVSDKREISFETSAEISVEKAYNGGFEFLNTENATSGKYSARVNVKGSSYAGYLLQQPITINGNVNFVKATLLANVSGTVKLGFVINNGNTILTTSDVQVVCGENDLALVLGKELANVYTDLVVNGIYLYNQSVYDNLFYIDSITFEQKTTVEQSEVIKSDFNAVYVEKNGSIIIPNVIGCDIKLIDTVSVKIFNSSSQEIKTAGIGTKLSLDGLAVGEYSIKYFINACGKEYESALPLIICEQLLSGSIKMGTYYTQTAFELPQVELVSGAFGETELSGAVTTKYYKLQGGTEWIEGNDEVTFDKTGYVDLKYSIAVNDAKTVLFDSIYVHQKGVHLDFEKWANGDHMGYKYGYGQDPNYNTTPTDMPSVISTDWAYDGLYSMKVVAHTGYTNVSGAVCAIQAEQSLSIGFEADMVVFWAYSEGDRSSSILRVDNYDWNWASANLQIKKGVHKYVLPLSQSVNSFKRLVFELGRNESFYIDNVYFVKSAEIKYTDVQGKQYDRINGITVTKPELLSASDIAFSKEEVNSAKFSIEVFDGKDTITYYFEDDKQTLDLDLKKGKYEFTYKVIIGEYKASSTTYKVSVRDFECEFIQPKTIFESGVLSRLDLPKTAVEGVTIKAYSRVQNASEWTELNVVDGKALVTFNGAGNYELKFTAVKGEYQEQETYQVLVRAENSIADFEMNEDGSHVTDNGIISEKHGYISDKWSYDGNYSFRISTKGHDYAFVYFMDYEYYLQTGNPIGEKALNSASNAITMWINADNAIKDFQIDVYTTPLGESKPVRLKSQVVDVQKGVNAYTFIFEKSFNKLYGFGFEVHYSKCNNFYIDGVCSIKLDIEMPEIKTSVYQGGVIAFSEISADIDGKKLNVNVEYKLNDGDYTEVTANNGKYSIQATTIGTIQIRITLSDDSSFETVYNYIVEVKDSAEDSFVGDMTWQEPN